MFRLLARARKALINAVTSEPDLSDQYEELLIEVWAQERFERTHPITCAAVRLFAIEPEARQLGDRRL